VGVWLWRRKRAEEEEAGINPRLAVEGPKDESSSF
jgi:hypothetical protein